MKSLALAFIAPFALLAACTPSAVASDIAVLDAAVAKDVVDLQALKAAPSNLTLVEAVVQDGVALAADIAQLKADLGSAPVPAKAQAALAHASTLAADMRDNSASVAEAQSVSAESAGL